MTRKLVAIALFGTVFSIVSGTSQAAPMAPIQGAQTFKTATEVSWHEDRGSRHHGHRRGGLFGKFGGMKSIMAMMASSGMMNQVMGMMGGGGGGFDSFGGSGGSGGMGQIMSMMASSGAMDQMMGMMGGSGGMGQIASMMGGSGGMGSMMSAMGGGGGGFSAGRSSGGTGEVSEAAKKACAPDAFRLCSDAIPNIGKVKACMQAKYTQLSEPCRAAMASAGGAPSGGQNVASSTGGTSYASYGGQQRYTEFRRDDGNYGGGNYGGRGYDQYGAVRNFDNGGGFGNFGGGNINIGQIMGMARSMGLGSRDNW